MGGILCLYQSQRLFIICAYDTDVTENSHGDSSFTADREKKKEKTYPYFFTLVMVHYLAVCIAVIQLYVYIYMRKHNQQ